MELESQRIGVELMEEPDLPAVLKIQAQCFPAEILENVEAFRSKLKASPGSCFVARADSSVVAYLISIPVLRGEPPMINSPVCDIPAVPECLYLHDLAVAPAARKSGAGKLLVERYLDKARSMGISKCCLIAVQNSSGYWARYGFRFAEAGPALQAKLKSYGRDAAYMTLELPLPA